MAEKGMFRKSFRGFNKQDVLQYVDEITAAWDEERKALQTTTDEAVAKATAAAGQLQIAEDLLREMQQKLTETGNDLSVAATTIEEMATQLEAAQRRMAQLEQELAATAEERDTAIAALADAKTQLENKNVIARELDESRQRIARQDEQIDEMQQSLNRYHGILGDAASAQERVEGIVRPYMDRTARQADDALGCLQETVAGLMAQLTKMQNDVDLRRQALRNEKADNDAQLTGALDQWKHTVQDAGGDRHFFR